MLPPSGTRCNLKSWTKTNSWLLIDILKYTKQVSLDMMKKTKCTNLGDIKVFFLCVNWEFIFKRNPAGGDILSMIFFNFSFLFFFFQFPTGLCVKRTTLPAALTQRPWRQNLRILMMDASHLALSVWSLGHSWARRLLGGNEFQKAASIIHIYKRTAWPLLLEMRLNEGQPYLGPVLLKCHGEIFLIRTLSPCWRSPHDKIYVVPDKCC